MKKILVFNVGSSTIKFSMFEGREKTLEGKYERLKTREDYVKAFNEISKQLYEKVGFDMIVHRVVHGGNISKPARIDEKVKERIKKYSKFAPLHNPKELMIINLAEKFKKPQYAVFDTAFFVKLPKVAKIYPIPIELIKKYHIQRFGFHGLSHESVSKGLKGKTITCHLGQGASLSAIKNSKAIDTSMGLTPLEGIMMMTRSGSIDPGLILFLEKKGHNAYKLLNLQSGFKGLTGLSDFKEVLKNLKKKEVKLAYDIFVYQIIKFIGAYSAVLDGLNNLVFTGAIGENSFRLREDVCEHLDYLGVGLDKAKNKNRKNLEIISSKSSKVKVYVKHANEDVIMVEEVMKKR